MFADRTNWRLAQNQLTEAVDAVRAGQTKLLDLTVSNPTRVGLEYDAAAILAALHSPQALDYDPQAKGLLAARQAVAAYYADATGSRPRAGNVSPERIVLTTSTSEGY